MTLNSSLHVLLDPIHVLGLIAYLSFNPDNIGWFLIVEVNMDYPLLLTSPVLKKKKKKTKQAQSFVYSYWFYFLELLWVSRYCLINRVHFSLVCRPPGVGRNLPSQVPPDSPFLVPFIAAKLSHLLIIIQACDFSLFFLTSFPSPPWRPRRILIFQC